ncbi:hypothetical protein INT48_006299 [Thamnidium elegans]|uniref:mitogen-activated protein kinase kinase n=1 Tax=Thamnidium elegans TaxID=101142 RepID=A0A8H7SPB4_9FUNG|nr:hypothetical protein INT48_006299 [Thamnidium elegans]
MKCLFGVAGAMLDKISGLINYTGLNIFQADDMEFQYNSSLSNPTGLHISTPKLQYNETVREYTGRQADLIQPQNSNNIGGLENMYISDFFRTLYQSAPTDPLQPTHINLTQTVFKKGSVITALKKLQHKKQEKNLPILPDNSADNKTIKNNEIIFEDDLEQALQQYQFQQQRQQHHNSQELKNEWKDYYSKDEINDQKKPDSLQLYNRRRFSKVEVIPSYRRSPERYYNDSLEMEGFPGKKVDRLYYALKRGLTKEVCLNVQRRIIEDGMYYRSYNKKCFLQMIKKDIPFGFVEEGFIKHIKPTPQILGEGVNGKVIVGRRVCDNNKVALKMLEVSLHCRGFKADEILLELSIMSPKSAHRNIVRLQNFYFDEPNDKIVIAMDLMKCPLNKFIRSTGRKLPEEHTLHILNEITAGLLHLRKVHGVFHNDVKSDNILIGFNGEVKVADFGMVKYVKCINRSPSGTIAFMAPEVADRNKNFGDKSDIWSLGLVLIEMIDGQFSYIPIPNENEAMNNIARINVPPCSQVLKQTGLLHAFSQRLVTIDPDERASLTEIKHNLKMFTHFNLLRMSSPKQFRDYFQHIMNIRNPT